MSIDTDWTAAVRRLGGDPGATAAELTGRYGEPHRRYHTASHAAAVVRDAAWLGTELGLSRAEQDVITLAACAHDVVYDAKPGQDERASADWVRAALTGVAPAVVDRVAALVLATTDHVAEPGDLAAAVLLDADLAILGAPPQDYAAYAAAVRDEYAAVPDEAWRAGRRAVLRRLLARDPLYLSAPARGRWGAAARINVGVELAGLG